MTGKKEPFSPMDPSCVRVYACGPTTYNFIHIGNLRAAMVADLFVRFLRSEGFRVQYVRNYTDVDDKIINEANKQGIEPKSLAEKFIKEAELDYAAAGLLDPDHKPRVSETIPEIIQMIETLVQKKHAYVTTDGEVLFSIDSFSEYGKLSRKKLEDNQAGARVEVNHQKKNPFDFALWKPAKPGEPFWESPWGIGRPGWHIECSAMIYKILGSQIDLHLGGEDLIFPHHENEIAQSECALGCHPFVKYWVHNAFLTLSQEKMSKSLGNVFLARDFLTRYSGEVARFLLLSVHYRSILDFNTDTLENALSSLQRIYEAKEKALSLKESKIGLSDMRAESAWGEFVVSADHARREIKKSYQDDLNTPGALAALFTLIRQWNRTLMVPHATHTPSALLGAEALIDVVENSIGSVIGIGRLKPSQFFETLQRIRREELKHLKKEEDVGEGLNPSDPTTPLTESEILAAIEARAQARAQKNFAESDRIRKDLELRGVLLKDTPEGTTWEYKKK
jgi:cysteinyl-tRNA synthetase